MDPNEIKNLIQLARKAMENSYCPYSKFPVGCALLCNDETIFTGCNVENANYCGSICAERTAFVKAISEGNRHFKAVAITTNQDDYCSPCGNCRQFMSEFGTDLYVILVNSKEEKPNKQEHTSQQEFRYKMFTLNDLLPLSFGPKDLQEYNRNRKNLPGNEQL